MLDALQASQVLHLQGCPPLGPCCKDKHDRLLLMGFSFFVTIVPKNCFLFFSFQNIQLKNKYFSLSVHFAFSEFNFFTKLVFFKIYSCHNSGHVYLSNRVLWGRKTCSISSIIIILKLGTHFRLRILSPSQASACATSPKCAA